MSEELSLFFKDIEISGQYFLFARLYNNPRDVLGSKEGMDEAEEEYFELPDFCSLILNNNLTKFLTMALKDASFRNKLDFQLYRKLSLLLWDSVDFKEKCPMQNDEVLMKLFKQEITPLEYIEEKGLPKINASLLGVGIRYDYYIKYKRLFDQNYSQKQVDEYDEVAASNLRHTINYKLGSLNETMQREETLNIMLQKIATDDYSEDGKDIYLSTHSVKYSQMDNYKLFDATVCRNEFLDIMDRLLEFGEINGSALDNAVEIINFGVWIKTYTPLDAPPLRKRLGETLIKEFDLKRAQRLLSDIAIYRINKERQSKTTIVDISDFQKK